MQQPFVYEHYIPCDKCHNMTKRGMIVGENKDIMTYCHPCYYLTFECWRK